MEILSWSQLTKPEQHQLLPAIQEIFFVSSKKQNFESAAAKQQFWQLWCENYLENYPELFFLGVKSSNESRELLAYLTGCENTIEQMQRFLLPGQQQFETLYHQFPAHLHINAHPKSRGMGVGSRLIAHYIKHLKSKTCAGVHLITAEGERNISFYERNGFNTTCLKKSGTIALCFMGQTLSLP